MAGPAVVVVAGIALVVVSVRTADPLVAEDYYKRGIEIDKRLAPADKALAPCGGGERSSLRGWLTGIASPGRGS